MDIDYPFVQIFVVAKNEEGHISDCVRSLRGLDYPADKFEIVVIDGGSTDRTVDIANEYGIRVVIDRDGGLAHSRNIAIRIARSEYIALTDADCIVKEDWLKKLVENIIASPDNVVAVGGPNLVLPDDEPFARLVGHMQETFFASGGSPQCYKIIRDKYVFSIHNCNIIYKRKILIHFGGYNDDLNVGEDAELNFRLKQNGYLFLYRPEIIVWHRRPNTIRDFTNKMYSYGMSMGKITRLHKKVVRWYSFIPTIFIVFMILMPMIFLSRYILYLYCLCLLAYFALLLTAVIQLYRSYPRAESLFAIILLPAQHIFYGVGFAFGLLKSDDLSKRNVA